MRRGVSLLFLTLVLASCDALESEIAATTQNDDQTVAVKGIRMMASSIPFDDDQTRTAMEVDDVNGLSFTWTAGDATGVYSTTDGFARFALVSGEGLSNATFDGSGFSLTDGSAYYAFYPYELSSSDKTAIPLVYSGQSVSSDDDKVSPMTKDYMWASAVSDNGNAMFSFAHIGAFLRVRINLPADTALDKLELLPMYGEVPQTMAFDITDHTTSVGTAAPVMTVATSGMSVPESGTATVWVAMPPQSFSEDYFAVNVYSGSDVYSSRIAGKAFNSGKAYKWNLSPVDITTEPGYGFTRATETGLSNVTSSVGAGEYSGITYLGGNQYAVVHDKLKGGGIVFYDITIYDDGTVGVVSKTIPEGTSGSAVTGRDNEGVAFVPGTPGTLFVSAEADQTIKEYDLDGNPTGRSLTIPSDMESGKITSNKGFEALSYNAVTGLFWTTTEAGLPKDSDMSGLLRLQSFGMDLKAAGRYLYQMDAPTKSAEEAAAANSYVFGVPALAALDDGRIIALEREVFVPNGSAIDKAMKSFTKINLYVVNPAEDSSGILRKTLLKSFTTRPLSGNFANYEGMCLGPSLPDGSNTLVMIPDSQNGSGGLTQEFVKVISFK